MPRAPNAVPFSSRSGFTNPLGKLGPTLGQLRLREETEPLVRAAAAKAGVPIMEFVREYLEMGFHSRSAIERAHSVRLDVIERVLPNSNEKRFTE